jgi:hypothetical protein
MSALGQKRTSDCRPLMSAIHPKADIGKAFTANSKAAGQVSNQRLCLRSQRAGLGWRRRIVEPATSLPFRSRGTCPIRLREKLTVPPAVLRQINC